MNLFSEFKLRGEFLIATSSLRDTNFYKTVVLIVKHDCEGAIGLVLNRVTPVLVKKVWHQVVKSECAAEGYINAGGPVESSLMAIHDIPALGEYEVFEGVYFSSKLDQLESLVKMGPEAENIRFYLGYAGWQQNQLEAELSGGSWHVMEAIPEYIFHYDSDLWSTVMKRHGLQELMRILKIPCHLIPDNVLVN